jgi:hypothetical protein
LRIVLPSACVKAWKSFTVCSGVMPMPVSRTRNTTQLPVTSASRVTSSVIVPFSVNFAAFERRFSSTCRTFVTSSRIWPTSGATRTSRRFDVFSTSGCAVAMTSSTRFATSNVSRKSFILPASTFERSRTSLINPSRCLPEERIFWRSETKDFCPAASASSSSISLYPMIAFSGVRSSWLMFARNALFAWFASSAALFASSAACRACSTIRFCSAICLLCSARSFLAWRSRRVWRWPK